MSEVRRLSVCSFVVKENVIKEMEQCFMSGSETDVKQLF